MFYPFLKRPFDLFCSLAGLLALIPLGLLACLLIKLCDAGPIFYRQIRVGQFGKPFRILKFRTMVVNADEFGAAITCQDDPRITWIGRILRKMKLDELPQLWNVLVGEMSLVGPRPEVPRYVERYTPEQRGILQYKPGITDRASLLFWNEQAFLRGAEDVEGFYLRHCLPKKLELNRQYAERATLPHDIWIILQTLCPYWLGVTVVYSIVLAFGFWLAYALRSDFRPMRADYDEFERFLPLMVLSQLLCLLWRGQLRGLMGYFSIPEMRQTVAALGIAAAAQLALCYRPQMHLAPAPNIVLMDFILAFSGLCGVRMSVRLLREHFSRGAAKTFEAPRRVAIIGTGELATNLVLDLARSANPARRVVAFFDDNPHAWHKRPHDIPVMGMPECLLNREWLDKIDEVIVTLPEEDSARIREISEMLKGRPMKLSLASRWPVPKASPA